MASKPEDRIAFEDAVAALKADVTATAGMAAWDAQVRTLYQRQIATYTTELRRKAQAGRITWAAAATEAQTTRNTMMHLLRGRSSPVGRALAQALKREGKTLNELVARYTIKRFGSTARFDQLTATQRNQVYGAVVEAAGRSNPQVNTWLLRASYAAKGLIVLSIGISVYKVATAADPWIAAGTESAVTGAGISGGVAGGAIAGLACGPGAPVCVAIGAFIGGAMAAFGVSVVLQ